ncbi:molybdopterin-binding protein [Leifsonia shinshuensis]|uniref:molybdopterin-binding protein n=1 Tax=Leifsonia shinshuensis TaxID=150026 RepID=UPI00285A3BCB|nr:molybdopterin-binding protein [Leifsonia shinshuensis]MDR6972129.1 molybdopterin molybdotransferase [Leifsonia shinshuensis]
MTTWSDARELAHELGRSASTRVMTVPTGRAAGLVLASDARCAHPLPRFDNSAMDGWAVAGDGPWRAGEPVLAGNPPPAAPLAPGEARPVATGAPVPPCTLGIVRSEQAIPSAADGLIDVLEPPLPGVDIRREGEEAVPGEVLLAAGVVLSPPALGLLAAAGVGQVDVSAPPLVAFVAIGDELTAPDAGTGPRPAPGAVPDSLTPMMPSLLTAFGARCATTRRASDRPDDVAAAIRHTRAETIITSGGTAHGPADPLREALRRLEARILIDGVALRPGGSVLLALLPDGRHLLGLPGNPLAAVVALAVLGWPLIQGRLGRALPALEPVGPGAAGCAGEGGHGSRDRAVACTLVDGVPVPVRYQRSGMLRGVAAATHLVLTRGDSAQLLRLPWAG